MNLIASFVFQDNLFYIGKTNDLLFRIPEDLKRFYNITKNKIVVMGTKTYESLPQKPLKNRINIIFTRNSILHNLPDNPNQLEQNKVYYTNLLNFREFFVTSLLENIFIIGGEDIYNLFLKYETVNPVKLYLTQIFPDKKLEIDNSYRTMIKPPSRYSLSEYSDVFRANECSFRYLTYELTTTLHQEYQYLNLCRKVLDTGNTRVDRTNTGTISLFGTQMSFDISNCIPLITTKRVAWRHCIEELLWFLRGDTDARILQRKGVKIWDGNSSRQFLDRRGLTNYEDGILGPIYGWQWRFFGAKYYPIYADTSKKTPENGIDQIEKLIHSLKTDPFSRRHIVSAWNPTDLPDMALPPCHYTFQFYVEEHDNQKYLSCHFIMRSNDLGCGTSFNLFSYAALTYIIALKVNMKPKQLVYTCSDTHIYTNHIEALNRQLSRKPVPFPKLIINPEISTKKWNEIDITDFELIGYFPEPSIKMEMAV